MSVFSGIVWERRYDGSYEVTDQYTRETFICSKCADGKWAFHHSGIPGRYTKLEIAQIISEKRRV